MGLFLPNYVKGIVMGFVILHSVGKSFQGRFLKRASWDKISKWIASRGKSLEAFKKKVLTNK